MRVRKKESLREKSRKEGKIRILLRGKKRASKFFFKGEQG